ncbi:MAG: mechanosensitive ion channel family protein [Chloroflexota bacterium]|nr:mechanosensitive ion channel family protein [Chloroflexota bacterium]
MDGLTALSTRLEAIAEDLINLLPNLLLGLLVFWLIYLLSKRIRAAVTFVMQRSGRSRSAALVFGRLTRWGIVFGGVLIALTIILPSFNPAQLIELLGISGVAIGFAFRDILQNFLAGILLLLTEPFKIGDQIIVGNYEGTVEDIQARATYITTYDGRRVVIPNATLFTDSVTVNTAFERRRTEYDVGIGYGDDTESARSIMLEAMRGVPGVLPEPAPDVIVVELAPSSVNLRARWWSASRRADILDIQDQVITAIKKRLLENGIDIPFPTQHMLFHDQTEETDGDRARQREGWPAGHNPPPKPRRIADALLERRVRKRSKKQVQRTNTTGVNP